MQTIELTGPMLDKLKLDEEGTKLKNLIFVSLVLEATNIFINATLTMI